MIVIDTNIIAYLYLTSPRSEQAENALMRDPEWAAPLLWRSEFRNVLSLYMRKRILSLEQAIRIMDEATLLMRGNEYEVPSIEVLRLAEESSCSAYDCEFVALARDLKVPLVTVDKQILRQFPGDAVSLDDFLRP
ncbi:MAG: type II toxin-antitoxin system VapC family toxin [Deltaproteobacteria bacterium]|nr:type II toxin-antitoxin system VapC family toxin [Deltaproteobacteria bacterium]MBW1930575.1 type II toxin-antitoxin system VapC family toxin [Deltaproteobacteria bacterium]MBW2026029.1 type II toxin-antitoxin system VapC family toxin [Deltaproteobacteria bacterium]MBW2126537.1 type II toxin-antitoxin system VapC family toxin [Deltaproteobacteria bacterium]